MKKNLPETSGIRLDIMLVLWNNTPPMTRPEIEKVINMKKNLASTTNFVIADRLENKKFRGSDETGKNESVYTPGFAVRLSGT